MVGIFHMARHTFATMSLSKGVPMESVSKMLGHTNIKTTQIYTPVVFICEQIVVLGQCNAYWGYFIPVCCRTFAAEKIKTTHHIYG